jgi:hypothetical protein
LLPNFDRSRANVLPHTERSAVLKERIDLGGLEDSINKHLSTSAHLMKGSALLSQEGNHLKNRHFEILA